MRIAKFIATCGVCSRRDAEKLIAENRVKLNGNLVQTPATITMSSDVVMVDDKIIEPCEEVRLWVYYKPAGLVTTHKDEHGRPTVFENIKGLPRVISVGRLDLNSEGLLLLTNSGEMARKLELPINKFDRVYKVRAFGNPQKLINYGNKFNIDSIKYHFKSIKLLTDPILPNNWFEIVLQEGKNREIRRVFEHFNLQVNRLIRIKYANYELGDLRSGEVQEIKIVNSL